MAPQVTNESVTILTYLTWLPFSLIFGNIFILLYIQTVNLFICIDKLFSKVVTCTVWFSVICYYMTFVLPYVTLVMDGSIFIHCFYTMKMVCHWWHNLVWFSLFDKSFKVHAWANITLHGKKALWPTNKKGELCSENRKTCNYLCMCC